MKRWMAWLGVVCAAGLMFSACGGSPTSRETSATAERQPPILFLGRRTVHGGGKRKPRLLAEEVELPSFSSTVQSLPAASGRYLLSPNGKKLSFSPRYNSLEDNIALYAADTAKGTVKTVCKDLAVDIEQFGVWKMVFRFGVDGTLYYIQQNREAVPDRPVRL